MSDNVPAYLKSRSEWRGIIARSATPERTRDLGERIDTKYKAPFGSDCEREPF